MATVKSYVDHMDTNPVVRHFEFNWEADDWAGEEILNRVEWRIAHNVYFVGEERYNELMEEEAALVFIEYNDVPDPR